MGHILYGAPPTQIDIDDRALAHVQIVITNKLRRSEAFLLTLPADVNAGIGRRTLWMHCALPIQFSYVGSRMPAINPAWIELLTRSANSGPGLHLVDEPQPAAPHSTHAA